MKILVTGANGYLGRGVVKQLLNDGHEVIATGFRTHRVDERAICMDCDLFALENPYEYFGKPDVLLHMAWRDGFVHYALSHLDNLSRHFTFLKSMIDAGIPRIAVMGSMHEVGFFEGSINENTPCRPMSLYGIGKNALRNAVEMMTKSKMTAWQWLRGYYIVGNEAYGSSVFSKIVEAADMGKHEFPFTMGQNQFDFLNYNDFCYDVAKCVEQDKVNGIIEVCSGHPEKLADRVERFIEENHLDISLQYGKFADRPYDSKAVWGNDSKIRAILEQVK